MPLSRAVVQMADGTDLSEVCAVIAAAERGGAATAGLPPMDLPSDPIVVAAAAVSAAANVVGLGVALVGRTMMWPRLPASASAVVTLVDYQPRLRRVLEDRFGHSAADSAIALAAAAAYTLTLAPASLAVDAVVHAAKAAENAAAAAAWVRREPGLARHAQCTDDVRPTVRPRPLPPGPVERHGDRSGLVQGLAVPALGLLTADVSAAATAAIVAAPKAARTSRETFAATLGRGLADNHGVLPLRPKVFRHLDRVDAVVVDPRALCTGQLCVGRIRDVAESDRAAVWRWAQRHLSIGALRPGWSPVSGSGLGHRACGAVLIRHEHHPLAAAVLGEIRRSGARAVSVDLDTLDEMRSYFDDLDPLTGSIDHALADAVGRLQAEGHTVAAVSRAAAQALADADVAIGVGAEDAPCWHAHLLVDDLDGVWRIVHALPEGSAGQQTRCRNRHGRFAVGRPADDPGGARCGPGTHHRRGGRGRVDRLPACPRGAGRAGPAAVRRPRVARHVGRAGSRRAAPTTAAPSFGAAVTTGEHRSGGDEHRRVGEHRGQPRGGRLRRRHARGTLRSADTGARCRLGGQRGAGVTDRRGARRLGADRQRGAGRGAAHPC